MGSAACKAVLLQMERIGKFAQQKAAPWSKRQATYLLHAIGLGAGRILLVRTLSLALAAEQQCSISSVGAQYWAIRIHPPKTCTQTLPLPARSMTYLLHVLRHGLVLDREAGEAGSEGRAGGGERWAAKQRAGGHNAL